MKRLVCCALTLGLVLAVGAGLAWADTDTEVATVTADMALRAELDIVRDNNSVTRFTPNEVVFDRFDDQDGLTDGNPNFMYAPYRSDTGKNWHLASIVANGSSMTLSADVSGTAGGTLLANIMDVFCGGFFETDGNSKGGESTAWELADSFTRTLNEPFAGTVPLNYRLRVRGVTAGSHAGTVTYTLTSN